LLSSFFILKLNKSVLPGPLVGWEMYCGTVSLIVNCERPIEVHVG